MSSRDILDSILDNLWTDFRLTINYNTLEEQQANRKRSIKLTKQAIHQWALDIIGEDEELNYDHDIYGTPNNIESDRKGVRNYLRAEQRLKLKGDIDGS